MDMQGLKNMSPMYLAVKVTDGCAPQKEENSPRKGKLQDPGNKL